MILGVATIAIVATLAIVAIAVWMILGNNCYAFGDTSLTHTAGA
jgi:hypothetical protein